MENAWKDVRLPETKKKEKEGLVNMSELMKTRNRR